MQRAMTQAVPIGLFLTILLIANGLCGSVSDPLSQISSVSAAPQPTATYVSELGPAVMLPPRQAMELPASGAGIGSVLPWPKAAGLGLALLGSLLIHAALTLRPGGTDRAPF